MKALVLKAHGEIGQVALEEVEAPKPKRGEVLVNIKAAALNHLDLWVVHGMPGLKLQFPHVLGADGSGVVAQVGEGVTRVKRGDPVMINPGLSCGTCEYCEMGEHSLCPKFSILGEHVPGTFAEYVAVPETNVVALPKASSYEEAAASSLVFLTAWRMLVTRGRIKPSETILIHGIGGGVSLACMQIALATGLRAIVTSSSTDKVERAMGLGAHFGINHTLKDVAKEVRELTNNQGVDIVVDSVGEQTWGTSLKCLKKGGRLVTCGATTGGNPSADINRIFWNQISIIGSTMGSMNDFREFVRFMGIKKIRPIIHRSYSLKEGMTALEDLKNQRQFGKIVLNVS